MYTFYTVSFAGIYTFLVCSCVIEVIFSLPRRRESRRGFFHHLNSDNWKNRVLPHCCYGGFLSRVLLFKPTIDMKLKRSEKTF